MTIGRPQRHNIPIGIQIRKKSHLEVSVDPNQQFMIRISGRHELSLQRMDLSKILVNRTFQERIDQHIDLLSRTKQFRLLTVFQSVSHFSASLHCQRLPYL